jgi:hypothetical protein
MIMYSAVMDARVFAIRLVGGLRTAGFSTLLRLAKRFVASKRITERADGPYEEGVMGPVGMRKDGVSELVARLADGTEVSWARSLLTFCSYCSFLLYIGFLIDFL